jgi:hypothetical protein
VNVDKMANFYKLFIGEFGLNVLLRAKAPSAQSKKEAGISSEVSSFSLLLMTKNFF